MNLTDKYADIASYQLYAYQEVAGVNPSTSLWKKVGDVRALPLPMACTLTQVNWNINAVGGIERVVWNLQYYESNIFVTVFRG